MFTPPREIKEGFFINKYLVNIQIFRIFAYMIAVQEIVDRCQSQLDSEGSERYLFDNDFKPAINYAQEYIISLFNSIFSQNKLSEESLRDLLKIRCWITSEYSRVLVEDVLLSDTIWTISAVYLDVTTDNGSVIPTTNTKISYYLPNEKYISSNYSAKRVTLEEYNKAKKNPFEAGNTIVTNFDLMEYAYINLADYGSGAEIEISPSVVNKKVAIAYLKNPTQIVNITDNVEFPQSLTGLIVDTALRFISVKQGDGTNLASMTTKDENKIITLMS